MLTSFEYHIVRIFKNDPNNPDVFEGIVEKAGKRGWKRFKNFEELREILASKQKNRKKR